MLVMKFGGSSLANAERIKNVAEIIKNIFIPMEKLGLYIIPELLALIISLVILDFLYAK